MNRRAFLKKSAITAIPVVAGNLNTSCETVNSVDGDEKWIADFEIMAQAAQAEAKTIRTYQEAIATVFESDTATPDAVKQTALLYSNHHAEHLDLFNKNFAEKNGFPQVLVNDAQPDDRLAGKSEFMEVVTLAIEMEFEAAQFYFSRMSDQLTTQTVRRLFADVFPMEVGHMIGLKNTLGQSPAQDAGLFTNFGTGL
jgi:rubrerythrin